jgi:methylmalonyl-CoA/ethylmalonyl-CoA epimerase
MILDLHHIAVAVRSITEVLPRWVDGLGLQLVGIEDVVNEKVKVAVLLAGKTRIELVEPLSDDSPVARFLEKRGPGLHHLAFQVDDTGAVMRVLAEEGVPLLSATPNPGAHGTEQVFLHPKYLGGVLAELVSGGHD